MYEKAKIFTLSRPRLKKVVGWVFLLLGLVALVTPLTPGAAVLLAVGCELIGLRLVFLDRLLKRHPKGDPADTPASLSTTRGASAVEA